MMKSKEEILKQCLAIAERMDRQSEGLAALSVGELNALLWAAGLDYAIILKGRPVPKMGKRNNFRQDKIKELLRG